MLKIIDCRGAKRSVPYRRVVQLPDVSDTVRSIIADVRKNGDDALRRYSRQFDGVELDALEVTEEEFFSAEAGTGEELLSVMRQAAENVRAFHEHQRRSGFEISKPDGVVLGQRVLPLKRAGIYVPGGTASYPSTVLMDCIPAKIAGVAEIIMVTPPSVNGSVDPRVLAAARIAGVDRVFKIGGAQAVAALAFGTQSVPAVDKIVGPGNVFVAEAKRQVFGQVAIDMVAGPSEILIISDEKSRPAVVAADMLSQAEHDKLASSILITTSPELAQAVSDEIERQLPQLPREEIAKASIDANGYAFIVGSLEEAVEISNEFAPEHLELCVEEPFKLLSKVENAGSVFLGRSSPEALGDYFAGPNHTLPTSGTARFSSPLGVDDFRRRSSYTYYPEDALRQAGPAIDTFARAEGLHAHGKSVTIRFED